MATTPPLLEIRLFGNPSVMVGRDATASLTKRAIWLLAILALRKGEAIERGKIAGMLWPDSPDAAALHNLRQTLAAIRRELGEAKDAVFAPTPRTVSLDSKQASVDLWRFDELCARDGAEELEEALRLHREPLLLGCDEPFALAAREGRERAFLEAAERLAGLYLEQGNHAAAVPVLKRVLAEDPYRETVCRALMSSLAECGDGPSALEVFREFRSRLRREVRTDVSLETKALFQAIRTKLTQPERSHEPKPSGPRLPAPLTSLVGRVSEIRDISALMGRCRLVTLTGPGGVGKTRLSLAVAEALSKRYLDGVWFVDLAPIQSGENIPTTVAAVLKIQEGAGKPVLDTLAAALEGREMLVILDNCEHVSDAVASLLEHLLSLAPGLHVLATSRQTLGVRGELVWPVPTLATPRASDTLSEVERCDAVQLFLARSNRLGERPLEAAELSSIAAICRRLDGLALAIELAAARTSVLPVAEIEARLADRFAILTSGSRTLERHQTLRACIEWSWDLLPDDERRLLMCLGVFRGGASLKAIEYVAARPDVIDLLSSLVDRSLAIAYREGGQARYYLLETIREFAERRLDESADGKAARDRHRDFFLEWGEEGYETAMTPEELPWFEEVEVDHDNFRAAIDWCEASGEEEKLVRLCVSLCRFWDTHGHLNEGRQQIERALKYDAPALSPHIRERAYIHAGWMAGVQGDYAAAIRHYENALPIALEREDLKAQGVIRNCMASALILGNQFDLAERMFREALALYRKLGQFRAASMVLSNLAGLALEQDDYRSARTLMSESLEELGGLTEGSAQISGLILTHMAFLEFREGHHQLSRQHALESIGFLYRSGLYVDVPFALLNVALADSDSGDWARVTRLIGSAQRIIDEQGTPPSAFLARAVDEVLGAAESALGEGPFEVALLGGRMMSLEEAVSFARSEPQRKSLVGQPA